MTHLIMILLGSQLTLQQILLFCYSSTIPVGVPNSGVIDYNLPLFAISRVYKHIHSAYVGYSKDANYLCMLIFLKTSTSYPLDFPYWH